MTGITHVPIDPELDIRWRFGGTPALPLTYHTELYSAHDWEIGLKIARDSVDNWWIDDAHGGPLQRTTVENVLLEVDGVKRTLVFMNEQCNAVIRQTRA